MSTYVLVHGSFHGGWCWEKIVPQLVQAGHKVVALDLPAHGEDTTPIAEVTLQSYVDTVLQVIDSRKEKVILVGHSFGGMVISQAAEQRPELIQSLVYVTAMIPQDGQFGMQVGDPNNPALAHLIVNEAEGWGRVEDEYIPGIYYNDCSPEDVQAAMARLVVEPLGPYYQPVSLTAARFGQLPKFFVECLQDNAISPAYQKMYYTQTPVQKVFTLNASHSPFLSVPNELAQALLSVAKTPVA